MADADTVEEKELDKGDEQGDKAEKKGKGLLPKTKDKRTKALIVISVIGVIIAFLTLRVLASRSSTTGTSDTGEAALYPSSTTATTSAVSNLDTAYQYQQNQINGIDTELAAILREQQTLGTQVTKFISSKSTATGSSTGHGTGSTSTSAGGTTANGQQNPSLSTTTNSLLVIHGGGLSIGGTKGGAFTYLQGKVYETTILYSTTATLTDAIQDVRNGQKVGYLSDTGKFKQFSSVTGLKNYENAHPGTTTWT